MKNKRGEQTVPFYLISLIILVVGLGIAFFLIGKAFFGSSAVQNSQVCHISVLTRATAPDALQANVPLKCTTDKVCFTASLLGGDCQQFAGEKNIEPVRLPSKSSDAAKIIEQKMADAMYDCWSMMGEGKLDLFAKASDAYVGSSGSPTCVVCRRLALSSDVKEKYGEQYYNDLRQDINLQRYLGETQIEGQSITYLKYLSGGSISSFGKADFDNTMNLARVSEKEIKAGAPATVTGTSNDQIAIMFSQVKTEKVGDVLKTLGYATAGVAGASAAFSLPLALEGLGLLYLGPQAIVTIPLTVGAVGAVALSADSGTQAAAGYCGKFETSDQDKQNGCSIIQPVNYNVKDLNAFCPGKIQGNP